jgi:hypothetical protein
VFWEVDSAACAGEEHQILEKKTTVGVAHSDADLGKPAGYTREQLDTVKQMIRDVADRTMGGVHPDMVEYSRHRPGQSREIIGVIGRHREPPRPASHSRVEESYVRASDNSGEGH